MGGLHLFTAFNTNIWRDVTVFSFPLSDVMWLVFISVPFPTMYANFQKTFQKASDQSAAAQDLIPATVLALLYFLWVVAAPELLSVHGHWIFLGAGFCYANLVGRMVLSKVCQIQFDRMIYYPLPLLISVVAAILIRSSSLNWLLCVVTTFWFILAYFQFALSVIREICAELKIRCLHLVPKTNTTN